MAGKREYTVRSGAPNPGHFHPFEPDRTGVLECFDNSEMAENAYCLGAHVFRAWLVTGKRGTVYSQNRDTAPGQEGRCCTPGRSRAGDEHIHLSW